jgi:hypothetical protein
MAEYKDPELPQEMEKALSDPAIPVDPEDPLARINDAFNNDPRPGNGDNTAVDPMGEIHSGSAIPDPIGDTLQEETASESLDYYQPDILDEDPVLGGPQGIANTRVDDSPIETLADMDENILDRLDRPQDQQ